MPEKEATARIKINKLLEAAGWRFFPEGDKPANISLEPGVKVKSHDLNALGEDFEKVSKGFIDFLLLDPKGFPLIVLEAKAEDKNPLVGKEQARKYAKSQNCRFIILSNGNLHYFWDLERGNPNIITSFPSPDSVVASQKVTPDPKALFEAQVDADYVALTQRPNYQAEAGWKNEVERPAYLQANKLRMLRPYQLKAIHALQAAVKEGKDRFLFEMATGTGKTLTAAAIIKLFLRSGNARRVLFLVDRLELEDQAKKNFAAYLSADYKTVVYKENKDDWRRAEIVVTTVQSLLFNNKYQHLFSPTDFDLVISDEAHRSIGGNARAVFDFFVGYKLGLTATPRDYLRKFDGSNQSVHDPREAERRLLLDTYRNITNRIPKYKDVEIKQVDLNERALYSGKFSGYSADELMEVIDDQFFRPRAIEFDDDFHKKPEAFIHTGKLIHFRVVDKDLDLPAGTCKKLMNTVAERYGLMVSMETDHLVRYEIDHKAKHR